MLTVANRCAQGGAKPAAVTLPTDIATDLAVLTFLLGMLSERVRRKSESRQLSCHSNRLALPTPPFIYVY